MYNILLNCHFLFYHTLLFLDHKDHQNYILQDKQNYQHLLYFIYTIQYNDLHQLMPFFLNQFIYESSNI